MRWGQGSQQTTCPVFAHHLWGRAGSSKSAPTQPVASALREQGASDELAGPQRCTHAHEFDERWAAVLLDDDACIPPRSRPGLQLVVNATSPGNGARRAGVGRRQRTPPTCRCACFRTRLKLGPCFQLRCSTSSARRAVLRQEARRGIFPGRRG